LSWEAILHAAISYVTRSSDNCILRKSVPLSKAIKEISQLQRLNNYDPKANNDDDEDDDVCDKRDKKQTCEAVSSDPIKAGYETSLRVLKKFVPNLQSTMTFVSKLQKAENGDSFCLPGESFKQSDTTALFSCKLDALEDKLRLFVNQDEHAEYFESLWNSFLKFASYRFSKGKVLKDALNEMRKQSGISEKKKWNLNKRILGDLGQTFSWNQDEES